jgi:hypothetical protein
MSEIVMSAAYLKGIEIFNLNKSIYFNPYRHKGNRQSFDDFERGYNDAAKLKLKDE